MPTLENFLPSIKFFLRLLKAFQQSFLPKTLYRTKSQFSASSSARQKTKYECTNLKIGKKFKYFPKKLTPSGSTARTNYTRLAQSLGAIGKKPKTANFDDGKAINVQYEMFNFVDVLYPQQQEKLNPRNEKQ